MRIISAAIVFACCLALSSATFRLLKSKVAASNYRTVNHLTSDAVLLPLLASYARITPTYTKNIATYKVSSPPVVKYAPSTTIYVTPQVYSAPAYSQPYTFGFDSSSAEYYNTPYSTYTEYSAAYSPPHITEDCDENSEFFNWK